MSNVAKKVMVNGVSACMKDHAAKYGLKYPAVMGRMHDGWTREQALGIDPPPVRQRDNTGKSALPDGPRLGTALDNLSKAISGELTGEEYLRFEGVPPNGYVLASR